MEKVLVAVAVLAWGALPVAPKEKGDGPAFVDGPANAPKPPNKFDGFVVVVPKSPKGKDPGDGLDGGGFCACGGTVGATCCPRKHRNDVDL